jgi:hypothetical protein
MQQELQQKEHRAGRVDWLFVRGVYFVCFVRAGWVVQDGWSVEDPWAKGRVTKALMTCSLVLREQIVLRVFSNQAY